MTAVSSSVVGTALGETPVYVTAGGEFVFGVLTRPVGKANGLGVLFLHAGAQNLSSHRNALWTRLARELSGLGYLCFRMDYHGTGDSSGMLADRSVEGQTALDVESVVDWLAAQDIERLVVVGTCWGGLVGLSVAARREIVHSVCLVTSPIRLLELGGDPRKGRESEVPVASALSQFLRPRVLRLLVTERDYQVWVLRRVRARMRKMVGTSLHLRARTGTSSPGSRSAGAEMLLVLRRRGVGIHLLFGEHERSYRELMTPGALPMLQSNLDLLDVRVTPVRLHGVTTVHAQTLVREQIREWLDDIQASATDTSLSRP